VSQAPARAGHGDGVAPEVSVIVPTYNRVERLHRVLDALENQTYPRHCYEVIVISDGSTDGTDEYLGARTAPNFVWTSQANAGPAAARNTGIELARGRLLVFVDDDVVACPELVGRHAAAHRQHGPGVVVIGPMLTPPDGALSPWVQWEQEMLYRQYGAMLAGRYPPTPRQFYTGNASVERAAVIAAGGFDTRFRRAEDIELAYRLEEAGLHFVFDSEAAGHHYAERSFASWLQIACDYGESDVIFVRDHWHLSVGAIVVEGFERRPRPVRWAIEASVASPRIERAVLGAITGIYRVATLLRLPRVQRYALSGLYNTSYYRGLAHQLGGGRAFRQAMREGQRELERYRRSRQAQHAVTEPVGGPR
jgi:GT2 family glycosyltransferase